MQIEVSFLYVLFFVYFLYLARLWFYSRKLLPKYVNLLPKFIIRVLIIIVSVSSIEFISNSVSKNEKNQPKDIFLMIDVSNSMNVRDIQPSRLEKVKFELNDLIGKLKDEKIGIIVFANQAKILCPLTDDYDALSIFLESINTDFFEDKGSDLNNAFEFLIDNSRKKTDLEVLLFTDGGEEQIRPNLITEINKLRITINTLGIGTNLGGIVIDSKGKRLKSENGVDINSALAEKNLKLLSQKTNGRYISLEKNINFGNELTNLLDFKESNFEKTIFGLDNGTQITGYLLMFALFLILIDLFLKFDLIKL